MLILAKRARSDVFYAFSYFEAVKKAKFLQTAILVVIQPTVSNQTEM